MTTIELSLEELAKFIPTLIGERGGVKYRALLKCIPVLEKSLLNNVFRKPHSDTVQIESKRELQQLIQSGKDHKPAPARPGAQYSEEYLARKRRLGEHYPHKYMDYGFWMGTEVYPRGDSLIMKAEPATHKGFDYLSHHEERRSVLKRAFLDAWQTIIETIKDHLVEEALSK